MAYSESNKDIINDAENIELNTDIKETNADPGSNDVKEQTDGRKENKMGVLPVNRLLITMSLPMIASMLVELTLFFILFEMIYYTIRLTNLEKKYA